MKEMNIPVGVSDFEEIRKNGYYYIDKSGLIGELLSRTGTKVTLITRPRRFGKTLGIRRNILLQQITILPQIPNTLIHGIYLKGFI